MRKNLKAKDRQTDKQTDRKNREKSKKYSQANEKVSAIESTHWPISSLFFTL